MIFLDVKHLKFSIEKYLNRCDQHIMEEFLFFFKKRAFYCLNQQLRPKRATKFRSE